MESASPVRDRLTRRTALVASLAGLGVLGAARLPGALGQGATPIASPVTAETEAAYLFIQAGFTAGSLADNGDGTYNLGLSTAPAQTVYFSDRPARVVGTIPTTRFLEVLDFDGDDPPNAALVIATDTEDTYVIVLELTSPAYDEPTASLTYTATVLEGLDQLTESSVGFEQVPLTAATVPSGFGACTLFVDSLLGCSPIDPRC